MKIRVNYSELVSGPGYSNRRAEAELEVDVKDESELSEALNKAWLRVKEEVNRELRPLPDDELPF